jgi:putative methyltransferase (TIGR04325 family)
MAQPHVTATPRDGGPHSDPASVRAEISAAAKRARIAQIRFCSRWLRRIDAIPAGFRLIEKLRRLRAARRVLAAIVGYNRPFRTLANATAAIVGYESGGHANADYVSVTAEEAQRIRLSDYPALFHIRPLLPGIRRVFDLGGGIGGLFYCYSKYLDIPASLIWIVYDLPATREIGEQLARERSESKLVFTNRLADAEGVDLFVACGSLHYFERPLDDLIAGLASKPRYVIINRTPLVDGPTVATVQDGGTYRLACILHNRAEIIRRIEALGYELVDDWRTTELSVIIPCYPDLSAKTYSGLFFRRTSGSARIST